MITRRWYVKLTLAIAKNLIVELHFSQNKEDNMKLSARNQLEGTVVKVQKGAVNAIVTMEVAGGNKISATISMNAVKELELTVGTQAVAVIKATSVMFGVNE